MKRTYNRIYVDNLLHIRIQDIDLESDLMCPQNSIRRSANLWGLASVRLLRVCCSAFACSQSSSVVSMPFVCFPKIELNLCITFCPHIILTHELKQSNFSSFKIEVIVHFLCLWFFTISFTKLKHISEIFVRNGMKNTRSDLSNFEIPSDFSTNIFAREN